MTSIKAYKLIKHVFCIKPNLFNNQLLNRKHLLIESRINYRFLSDFKNLKEIDPQINDSINERIFEDLTIDKYSELIKNQEIKEKIELILTEYEYEKYTTYRVPTTLTIDNMKELLVYKHFGRKKMIWFLFQKEILKIKRKNQKLLKSAEILAKNIEKRPKNESSSLGIFNNAGEVVYGLWRNSLFSRISKSNVSRLISNRLKIAALFGQKIVIDLDFDKYMKLKECQQLAKQLHIMCSYNKNISEEAFDLHFTNCQKSMPTMKAFSKLMPNLKNDFIYNNFHDKSYLDLFSKEKLVYLTLNAEKPLLEFNHDSIYIIGGFIDKSFHEPVTYNKAKSEGIMTYKLPIDEFILWSVGSKSLPLNHVLAILHDVKHSDNDWKQSLKTNIPRRKQKKTEDILFEDALRKLKYKIDFKNREFNK